MKQPAPSPVPPPAAPPAGSHPPPAADEHGTHLRRSTALQTATSVPTLQRRAERELLEARQRLEAKTQALEKSVSLLRATLECTPDGVVALDLEGRVVACNSRFAALWQLPLEALEQMQMGGPHLLTHIARFVVDPERFLRLAAVTRTDPEREGFDTFALRDGRTMERYISPQRLAGRCVGTVIHWRDVTEQRRAASALQAQQVAERANRAKTEFLSRMSHELRTPLNAIIGFSSVLMMDRQQPLLARQQEWVGHVQKAGRHLLMLINDVLDVSRLESGHVQIDLQDVEVLAIVQDAFVELQAQAEALRVQLQVAPGAAPTWVRADAGRFRQVMLNLLSNAVKYNRPGGSVTVRFEPRIGAHGQRTAIVVADTGIGMTEAQMAALYQPFNRLGRDASGVEGTGIGLVITRHLTELMAGSLAASSRPMVGSEFTVELAAGTPPAASGLD